MNKKIYASLMAVAILCFSIPAFAEIQVSNNGTSAGQFRKLNLKTSSGLAINDAGEISGTAGSPTYVGLTLSGLTASKAVVTDGSKALASSGTSATELGYVTGVTSAIQTQMDLKAPLASPTFTGTVTVPASTSFTTPIIGAATGTSLVLSSTLTGNGAVNIGDAVTDIATITSKIAGATPLTFDGTTADTVYTIFAFTDPTSSSKTITFPAATGTTKLQNAAAVTITAGATPTLTVPAGVDFIATDTITTDNQDQTITFSSGGTVGQHCQLVFQTDSGGSNDEVITLHTTLTNTTGTLTLANLTANRYTINLTSDGTVWNEDSRTGAQT